MGWTHVVGVVIIARAVRVEINVNINLAGTGIFGVIIACNAGAIDPNVLVWRRRVRRLLIQAPDYDPIVAVVSNIVPNATTDALDVVTEGITDVVICVAFNVAA